MIAAIGILSLIGICISLYGIYVENRVKQNSTYQASCDISDRVSCTKPFLSPYGKLLGVSNIWVSLIYYCCMFVLAVIDAQQGIQVFALVGSVFTIIFAYFLYVKIRSICLICTSLYGINALLMITAYLS
jgi:vitamin-K-epoxide reductase (warfarin-sensitive)